MNHVIFFSQGRGRGAAGDQDRGPRGPGVRDHPPCDAQGREVDDRDKNAFNDSATMYTYNLLCRVYK